MSVVPKTSFFSPSAAALKGKKERPVSTAFVEKIQVPVLPRSSADATRVNIGVALMAAGTSLETSLVKWKSYIAAYACAVTPAIQGKLQTEFFNFTQLTDPQVQQLNEAVEQFRTTLEAGDESRLEASKALFLSGAKLPGLPAPNAKLAWEYLHGEMVPKMIVSHFSIVLFLAGKRIDGDDHTAITESRPLALRKKCHIDESCSVLDGELRLSNPSHLVINNAWAEVSSLRAACFTEYARFNQMDTDFTQDLIYTSLHLLKFSGMQHAKITYDFLRAYPWAAEVPSLKTSIAIYVDSIFAASKYDAALQPYLKLIYSDKVPIFPRKELEPLVACAIEVAEEVNPTIKDFYRSADYTAIVEAFMEERARRTAIREGRILREAMEISDYITQETPESTEEEGQEMPASQI